MRNLGPGPRYSLCLLCFLWLIAAPGGDAGHKMPKKHKWDGVTD